MHARNDDELFDRMEEQRQENAALGEYHAQWDEADRRQAELEEQLRQEEQDELYLIDYHQSIERGEMA